MSKHASSSSTSYGAWALAAWLAALALFLIWLGWVLFSTSPIEGKAEKPSLPGVAQSDPGTVLDSLPAKGSLATPNMPFTASQEYVLTGAGLQGFYQTSAPNDVWTLSYPEPQLNAQVIKRGPPVPEIVTQGVDVTWELGPQAGLAKDSTTRQGRMNVVEDSFFAASIPVSAVNADGVLNPYPVITLRAKDEKTGKLLAESAAVLAVSPGFGCAQCHANAGTAILEVHDRHQSTHFMEQHAKGEVIACRSCHVGLKGGKAGEGKSGPELSVSAAIHGWHATYLADRGADACKTCHVDLGRTGDDPKDAPRRLFAVIFMWIGGFPACAVTGSWRIIPWRCSRPSKRLGCRRPPSSCPASRHARSLWTRSRGGCLGYRNRTAPVATISRKSPTCSPRRPSTSGRPEARGCPDSSADAATICSWCAASSVTARHTPCIRRGTRLPTISTTSRLSSTSNRRPRSGVTATVRCAMAAMDFSAHHPLVQWSEREIHVPSGARQTMPPARFSHQAHTPLINCTICHHTGYADGKSLLCTSSGCHDGLTATLRTDKNAKPTLNPFYFYNAFHGPYPSCVACHTESLAAGKPAGPTDCKACHQAPSPLWAHEAEAGGSGAAAQ